MKYKTFSTTRKASTLHQCLTASVALILFSTITTSSAFAGPGLSLCLMIAMIMGGGLANAIATVGVLMVGVGAALGRMSWTLAITVAVGIACMFATATIVSWLSGGPMGCFGK
jgi:type IV secretory pathway VirB2 component (pilin)